VLSVQLFNFQVAFKPLGDNLPQVLIPLQETTLVVLSKDFITNQAGAYGLGYAILTGGNTGAGSVLAYGPGHFTAGFQTIGFRVTPGGAVRATLAFAVNRPEKVMNIPYDPMGIAFRAINTLSLSYAGQFTQYFRALVPPWLTPTGVDPMQLYIAAANAATGGAAAENFGISKTELDRFMLLQHFMQHYTMMTGAMATYHSVADWTANSSIPDWIRAGVLEAG